MVRPSSLDVFAPIDDPWMCDVAKTELIFVWVVVEVSGNLLYGFEALRLEAPSIKDLLFGRFRLSLIVVVETVLC